MSSVPAPVLRRVNQHRLPLALWDYGGEGPPVLFLHGFLDGGRSFEDLAGALQKDCRPLCLDWRGHGASRHCSADAAYHQLDHLKDLLQVLGELEAANEAVQLVVAHSMGGTIALMLAASASDRIRRLLLLDSVGGYAADAVTQAEQMKKLVRHLRAEPRGFRDFRTRAEAEARVRQNNPGLSEKGAERIVRHYLEPCAEGGFRVRLDPRLRGPNPYRFPEQHWQELCARVLCPTEVLAPEHGYMFRVPELEQRLSRIPHCTRVDIPKVGHHLHVEAPQQVALAVRRLLAVPLFKEA